MSKLSDRLRKARLDANLTVQQVADGVGLSREYYGKIERGKVVPLSPAYWNKLQKVLPVLEIGELRLLHKQSLSLVKRLSDLGDVTSELVHNVVAMLESGDITNKHLHTLLHDCDVRKKLKAREDSLAPAKRQN